MLKSAKHPLTTPPAFKSGLHVRKSPEFEHPGSAPTNPLGEQIAATPTPRTVQSVTCERYSVRPTVHAQAVGPPSLEELSPPNAPSLPPDDSMPPSRVAPWASSATVASEAPSAATSSTEASARVASSASADEVIAPLDPVGGGAPELDDSPTGELGASSRAAPSEPAAPSWPSSSAPSKTSGATPASRLLDSKVTSGKLQAIGTEEQTKARRGPLHRWPHPRHSRISASTADPRTTRRPKPSASPRRPSGIGARARQSGGLAWPRRAWACRDLATTQRTSHARPRTHIHAAARARGVPLRAAGSARSSCHERRGP
jgi:hypothetical protein